MVQWSNHRVMEWLRVVDLAEYAPNLRGSGVHGGLIVSRFSMFPECHWCDRCVCACVLCLQYACKCKFVDYLLKICCYDAPL